MNKNNDGSPKNTEIEDVGDEIYHPFDPTKVRVEQKPITIDALCNRIKFGEINLSPSYQRDSHIWTPEAQSRLIESLLIRIPIPAFYVDATDEDCWEVIDGSQRMTVLRNFIVEQSMKLYKMEFLTELNDCTFSMLQRKFQRRISEQQITIYAIQPGTPSDVKFNIFKRVNTGGRPLTLQEIRHAIYQGPGTDLLKSMSKDDRYTKSPAALKGLRMADRELMLRYFTYLRLDPYNLKAESLDTRLNETIKPWLNGKSGTEIAKIKESFFVALELMTKLFEKKAFLRPGQSLGNRKRPINKPLFEAWMVNLSLLNLKDSKTLVRRKERLKKLFESLGKNETFMQSIHQGTGHPDAIKTRFEEIKHIINRSLK